jgi:hypothetical protein
VCPPPLLNAILALVPEDPTLRVEPPFTVNVVPVTLVVIFPIFTVIPDPIVALAFIVTLVATPEGTESGLQLLAVFQFELDDPVKVWLKAVLWTPRVNIQTKERLHAKIRIKGLANRAIIN